MTWRQLFLMSEGKARHDFLLWSEQLATTINLHSSGKSPQVRGEDFDPYRAKKRRVGVEILKTIFVDNGKG